MFTDEYSTAWRSLDDSGGADSTELFPELDAAWTEAVLSPDLSDPERRSWAKKLAERNDTLVDEGLDFVLDTAQRAAEQGWSLPALQRVLQGDLAAWAEVEAAVAAADEPPADDEDDEEEWGEEWAWEAADSAQTLAVARLNVLERQERFQEYLYLAEAAGQQERYAAMLVRLGRAAEAVQYALRNLCTTDEALALARTLQERGQPQAALQIAEHGLTLKGEKATLAAWLSGLAEQLGETKKALAAARTACEAAPNLPAYQRVERLAGADWPEQRTKLLNGLRRSKIQPYAQDGLVEVFLHEGLDAEAIKAVNQGAHDALIETVVEQAWGADPGWALATCLRRAEAIMDAGQAARYAEAARWLAHARAIYRDSGREDEWQSYRASALERHRLKWKLRPLIEAL